MNISRLIVVLLFFSLVHVLCTYVIEFWGWIYDSNYVQAKIMNLFSITRDIWLSYLLKALVDL